MIFITIHRHTLVFPHGGSHDWEAESSKSDTHCSPFAPLLLHHNIDPVLVHRRPLPTAHTYRTSNLDSILPDLSPTTTTTATATATATASIPNDNDSHQEPQPLACHRCFRNRLSVSRNGPVPSVRVGARVGWIWNGLELETSADSDARTVLLGVHERRAPSRRRIRIVRSGYRVTFGNGGDPKHPLLGSLFVGDA
jgi:hypothetical protein